MGVLIGDEVTETITPSELYVKIKTYLRFAFNVLKKLTYKQLKGIKCEK